MVVVAGAEGLLHLAVVVVVIGARAFFGGVGGAKAKAKEFSII